MGTGAYHGEGEGGPHAVWVRDPNIPSDICEKLGMLAGTFHDHLDQKFGLMTMPETEPEIEPKIETKPDEPPVTPPSEDLAALVQEVQSLKERVAKLEAKLKGLKELL
jgi:hypothetical protein